MPIQKEDLTVDCFRERYVVKTVDQAVFCHSEDLITVILTYCNFGQAIERGQSAYVLSFSEKATSSLDATEIKALRTIVGYHNRIVFSIDQGGNL